MALSNDFVAIMISCIAIYAVLIRNRTRWVRLVGSAALIAFGAALVMVADSVPMFIGFGTCIIIGGLQLFEDVAALV